jgi:hypothetical protein
VSSLLRRGLPEATGDLAELQLSAISAGASCWIVDLAPYMPCRVAGRVERLTLDPVAGHMDASVTDGTGVVVARWAIRPPTPQMACVPGRFVVIEGVPRAGDDHLLILEPRFEIIDALQVA